MTSIRGKSIKALIRDVAEGYVTVNPIFLKSFGGDNLKEFYHEISKVQGEIRAEKFPHNDIAGIRTRNLKLQRLHSAAIILRAYARDRRISLA
jgi:hypothetical protein